MFKKGDMVNYNNPGHMWHGMQFSIDDIEDVHNFGLFYRLYHLKYGNRTLTAYEDEIESTQMSMEDFADFLMPSVAPKSEEKCPHSNVVKSSAAGKEFWYCKNCKEEVIQIYNGTFRKL